MAGPSTQKIGEYFNGPSTVEPGTLTTGSRKTPIEAMSCQAKLKSLAD